MKSALETTARRCRPCFVFVSLALGAGACGDDADPIDIPVSHGATPAPYDPGVTYAPLVTPDALATALTHPRFPAPVGARWVYEAHDDGSVERTVVEVLPETKAVWGVAARVVRDTVEIDGELVEDTWDWYAEDGAGNVWYLGEDTSEYEHGVVTCTCGAWEAGVGGALPGIVALAAPAVGDVYRQEFFAGEAEDIAEVVALDETVVVPAGTFTGCVKTREINTLEPTEGFKWHCPGVGLALEREGGVRVELVEVSGLSGLP